VKCLEHEAHFLSAQQGTGIAWAQAGPIRLIVPYPPGGPLDIAARALAERVKDSLGTVVVENRPGAGGNLGADLAAKAAPDGRTLVMGAVATHAINPWLYSKIPYDPIRDFTPITLVAQVPNVLVMNAEAAARLRIQTLCGPGGLCARQPRALELRQRRQRQRGPSGRRDVQGAGRAVCRAHPLRGRAAGSTGPGGRASRFQFRQPGRRFGQYQGWQAQGAGRDHTGPFTGIARRAASGRYAQGLFH
jgi:hypothetical protein